MSDLDAAKERLEKAIERLEAALAAQGGGADESLEKALVEARTDYERLRSVADTVSGRLDSVIDRLRATLEEDRGR